MKRKPKKNAEPVAAPQPIPQPAPAPAPVLDRKLLFLFWSVIAGGLFLRLAWLGRASLQIDEIVTIRDALAQPNLASIYQTELQRFFWYRVLPLFMFPIHWMGLLWHGTEGFPPEWLLRLPSALVGAATIPLCYLLGKELGGRRVGWMAMVFAAISPFHIYYSREAYAYGYVMFFCAGVLWMSLRLLQHDWKGSKLLPWKIGLGYVVFAIGFVHSHLTAMLFLSSWTIVLMAFVVRRCGWRDFLKPTNLFFLGLVGGIPYLVFSPFLLQLLSHGYKSTDAGAVTVYFSAASVRTLFGRMGWGEAWWSLVPFAAVLIAGIRWLFSNRNDRSRDLALALLIQLALYIVFQAVYQNQTHSRFEIRYFSSVFPILTVLAASGLVFAHSYFSGAGGARKAVGILLFVVLAGWVSLGDGLVVALKSRGYNYKDMARWIRENVPEGGVYAQSVIFEMRGVPNVYPTPGRTATFVSANATDDDSRRYPLVGLMRSFFTLNPQAYLMEIAPADLLAPEVGSPSIPRNELFARQVWLTDPAWEWLIRLKVLPCGEVQKNSANMPKILVSWNEPGDIQALATRNNRPFYHVWGPQWRYLKQTDGSPRMNSNWMGVSGNGQLMVGNTTPEGRSVLLQLTAISPAGCSLTVTGPDGAPLVKDVAIGERPDVLEVPVFLPPSAAQALSFNVKPRTFTSAGEMYVNAIEIVRAPAPAPASSN